VPANQTSANPHVARFTIDNPDPVALLRALGLENAAPVVLLDSAGGSADLARRHYLAWDPVFRLRARRGIVTVTTNGGGRRSTAGGELARRAAALRVLPPFEALRGATRLARLAEGPDECPESEALFGMISYDAVRYLETIPDTTTDDLGSPDIDVFLPGKLLRLDIATDQAIFIDRTSAASAAAGERARVSAALAHARSTAPGRLHGNDLPAYRANFRRREYEAAVERAREYIYAGDIFQANLSQRLDLCYTLPSLHLYNTLRTVNPSPFAGYLHMGDYELISSSPERLVSLDRNGWAETRPIAGTRPRGVQRPSDAIIAGELNLDPKERAEHIMLVDLERNDLGKVCDYGTVHVSELMVNEYYSHVIHIVSNVRGRLHPRRDAVHLATAVFPGGTITGCPKVRCMEIIDELETVRRGPYTGSFGWIAERCLDLNIIIRTLVRIGDRLFLQVGGGVVADSVPSREYRETLHKAAGMLRAVSASIAERAV
jgi:anthranilate synthase component 1/para-aminobenzoate synthetase component 1